MSSGSPTLFAVDVDLMLPESVIDQLPEDIIGTSGRLTGQSHLGILLRTSRYRIGSSHGSG